MYDAIIVALGNPGPKYLRTRHNAGFMLADLLALTWNFKFQPKSAWSAHVAEVEHRSKRLLLLKPQTYMNLSGKSLQAIYEKNKELRNVPLIALQDETDIPFARIKVKMGGSDAGHNGLKSLREVLGHGEFYRIRLGVGRPVRGSEQELSSYVLEPFGAKEEDKLIDMLNLGVEVLEALIFENLARAQELSAQSKGAEEEDKN
jgi:PTH1 family peptidyl-tRNA hydrolase